MDEEIRRTIGDSNMLCFHLNLYPIDDERGQLAWGDLIVTLEGEPVWCSESERGEDEPIAWTWVDLLEFLGKKWAWLTFEENYPVFVSPLHPGKLHGEVEKRWESMTEEQVQDEQDALYHFVGRHDLARGLKGVFPPALFLLRQGEKAWVCTDDRQALLPFDAVRRTLSELGECLAANVQTSDHPRARYALEGWRNREAVLASHFWHLRSGLGTETRVRLEGGEAPADFWEADPESGPADNELLAAARLSAGVVGIDDQRTILDRIKQAPHGDMRRIDELAMTIRRDLDATARPYEQGYALAANLALELNDASDAPVDPEALLRDWEIGIEELTLDNCPVDAVAVWGPRYGPVILLNIGEGARPRHIHGRRTTLAHEICHLLIDRDGALPFSEALGGRTPLHVEQRARAFAAEFLLPRENAVACVRHCESIAQALSELSQGFNVSREVAALQVRNSRAWFDLSEEEKSFLLRTSEG